MNKPEENVINQITNAIKKTIGPPPCYLHEPLIDENDLATVKNNLNSGFVSSVGHDIQKFENLLCKFTGARYAVAVINGTSALHISLLASGIDKGEEVLVPSLTFVGSANAISYIGAIPHFVDSEQKFFGIDFGKLDKYLQKNTNIVNNVCINKNTNRKISAIVPVHIFGMIGNMKRLAEIAKKYKLIVIEDAAEALGSFKNNKHAGLFGNCGCLSFNGNKIITTGGGGAVITNNKNLADKIRHLSTTSKVKKGYKFFHDGIGFNYRMPAINAALGISQLKKLDALIKLKRKLHQKYLQNFKNIKKVCFLTTRENDLFNNWLNSIQLEDKVSKSKDFIISELNKKGYECRPVWELLHSLNHFKDCPSMELSNAIKIHSTVINIPSSAQLYKNSKI